MHQLCGLLLNGLDDRWMTMPQHIDRDTGYQVQIILAIRIPHTRAIPAHKNQGEAFKNSLVVFLLQLQ